MKDSSKAALQRALKRVGGTAEMARRLREHGRTVKDHRVVYQWTQSRVPAEYCPDIEVITGVTCEELRPDVNWGALRDKPAANDAAEAVKHG